MRIVELVIDELEELFGFDAVALVNQPAHEAEFYAFKNDEVEDAIALQIIKKALFENIKENFVTKLPGESKDQYIARCIPAVMREGYNQDQATAICYSDYESFDETQDPQEIKIGDYQTRHYDMCPAATALYTKIENQEINTDMGLAIRSAKLQDALYWLEKHTVKQMGHASFDDVKAAEVLTGEIMNLARMMGLEEEHQYVLGHLQTIRELYQQGLQEDQMELDPSSLPDFIDELGDKKKVEFESYTDYPESATNAARRALEWRDAHPDQDCGTRVGWARANQLANRRPISEDTIARMASFARHLQHEDIPYSEGCGGLMVDAWGGRAGIQWAQRKLDEIREEQSSQEFSYYDNLPDEVQEKLLERLGEVGFSIKDIEEDYEVLDKPKDSFALPTRRSANPDLPTNDKNGQYNILYQYSGPRDSNNRAFCRRLLELDLLFRKEDIQKMSLNGANSQEFGYYDIFQYKGSFGCRHSWIKKYVYRKKDTGLLEVAALLMDQQAKQEQAVNNPQQVKQFSFAIEGDQQIVVGPLMIPDKLIFRVDENGDPYYVYFTEDTISKIARKMMKEEKLDDINLEHVQDALVDGYLLETWLVEDPSKDKQQVYGMDYPKGTWMGMYKVEDPKIWSKVKKGELKGFSIEGYFADRLVQN